MKIAILSQGPTVEMAPPDLGADVIIGINRVVQIRRCDWWAFADATGFAETVRELEELPTCPHFWTKHEQAEDIRQNADIKDTLGLWQEGAGRCLYEADLKPLPDSFVCKWARLKYTGCYALHLAWHLGATEVDCYGVDLGGAYDWRGRVPVQGKESRNGSRWNRERTTWMALCEALVGEGVHIRMARMVPWKTAQGLLG